MSANWMLLDMDLAVERSSSDDRPYQGPIIDVHLHAFGVDAQGPPPLGVCVGQAAELRFDARRPWPDTLLEQLKNPRDSAAIWSPTSDEDLRDQTLAEMERLDVLGVVSGPPDRVRDYRERAVGRVISAIEFDLERYAYTPKQIAALIDHEDFAVFGEITDQYNGTAMDDPRFDPFWDVVAERDVPIAVHTGIGPPGAAHLHPRFRAALHSPFALERLLTRHPTLRVYAMHAAWPMIDELKAMLYTYPQLHVDTGTLQMAIPRAEYHRFLLELITAGFGDRIMFGSDQIVWPGLIELGVNAINDAPIPTEYKRAILHDNASRFLRLPEGQR